MVNKYDISGLRNAEHVQFIGGVCDVVARYRVDWELLEPFYLVLDECRIAEETALAAEKSSEKTREKNEADRYRDRLHSKLFNYVKSILYDDRDPRYDNALRVMKTLHDTGNPTHLAENVESAMLSALGTRLEAHRAEVDAIGAGDMANALAEANSRFIALEKECRQIAATAKDSGGLSLSALRKQTDPAYRALVGVVNGYAGLSSKREAYRMLVAEMNKLVEKYGSLLSQRGKGGTVKTEEQE